MRPRQPTGNAALTSVQPKGASPHKKQPPDDGSGHERKKPGRQRGEVNVDDALRWQGKPYGKCRKCKHTKSKLNSVGLCVGCEVRLKLLRA